jgi:hypothetical protein
VKISVENHAGDLQARELKGLIDAAGPDFIGATIDSGNAVWAIEDPHLTLETLAPHVLTSHMRDSYVFNSDRGTAVQWCRMGDGNVGIDDYLRTYVQRCPGRTVNLEVIVVNSPRLFQLSRSSGVAAVPVDAGVGVLAISRALRTRHATSAAAGRSESGRGRLSGRFPRGTANQSGARGGQYPVDAAVSGHVAELNRPEGGGNIHRGTS